MKRVQMVNTRYFYNLIENVKKYFPLYQMVLKNNEKIYSKKLKQFS